MVKYALSSLEHGVTPSARAINDPSDATSDEVVVEDFDPNHVWDTNTSTLRTRNSAEQLDKAKVERKAALEKVFKREVGKVLPPHRAAAAHGRPANDPSLATVRALEQKTDRAQAAVDNAVTVEAVNAVNWEDF